MRAIAGLLFVILFFVPVCALSSEADQFLASRSIVGQIYFSKGSSQLSARSQQSLRKIVKTLRNEKYDGRLLRIEGFASPEGQQSENYDLSMQRAVTVRDFLQRQGLSAELFFTGHGEKNNTTAKLSERRRVDIAIYQETQAVKQLLRESGQIERFVIQ